MKEKNSMGEYQYENHVLNSILSEYKEALRSTQIRKEAFEDGVQWLYKQLLHLPNPEIVYINSPDAGKEISKSAKKINRLTVKNTLDRCLDAIFKKNGIQFDDIALKRTLLENLYVEHYQPVQDMISGCRKNGINLKKELKRIAYIDYYVQLGDFISTDFLHLKNLCCSGVYHVFFWDDCVFALTDPKIRLDEFRQLHSSTYPAIEWPQGPKSYYIYGREMPEWIFTDYGTERLYRRFLAEENEDIRSGIITLIKEREGDRGLLDFLKAELVDKKEIIHFSGYKEILRLFKTKEKFDYLQNRHGIFNQPYCWSEFTCPSTAATYLIDNSADFTDAVKAAKFLRPDFVSPNLTYKWSHDAC